MRIKTPFVLSLSHLIIALVLYSATNIASSLVKLPVVVTPLLVLPGLLLLVIGFVLRYLAFKRIFKFNKDFQPKHIPEHLITDSVFSISRNPAYTGVLLMWLGAFLLAVNLFMAVALVIGFIRFNELASREEKVLTEKFGEDYIAYKNKTHKWL